MLEETEVHIPKTSNTQNIQDTLRTYLASLLEKCPARKWENGEMGKGRGNVLVKEGN